MTRNFSITTQAARPRVRMIGGTFTIPSLIRQLFALICQNSTRPPFLLLSFFSSLHQHRLSLKQRDATKMERTIIKSYLRTLIIDHAQALYGAQYPVNHTWAVLTTHPSGGKILPKFISHVVVYDQPGSLQTWRVLVSSKDQYYNESSALEQLLDELKTTLVKKMMENGKLKTSED
jgi:hypothetical protein